MFLDIDMLALSDIAELFSYADTGNAVWVSKNPLRFEWASAMLFNCEHGDNRILTPDYVETAEGLHKIGWTEKVGEFPGDWNHLVMYDEPIPNPKLIHYTAGIPLFKQTRNLGYAKEWFDEAQQSMSAVQWETLMKDSVHARHVYARLEEAGHA